MSFLSAWVRQSPQDDFWLATVMMIVLAITGFIGAFYFFLRKRVMEDTPTAKIRSAAQGYVEFNGHGELLEGPPIIAPLTNTICTWYSYTIEEHRRSGKNSHWVTIENRTSDELFLVIDETGQCVIDPEAASVTPSESDCWYGHSSRPSSGAKISHGGFFSFRSGRYRYTEKRMRPKDPLYAMGLFKTVGGAVGEFNIDTDVRDLLREWKQDSATMLEKYDQNKDGQIDMQEWQKVRDEAFKEVMAKHSERKTSPAVNLLCKTCDKRRPYLLSAIPQSALIKRYNYYSVGLIVVFFLSGAFASWMISLRMAGT